ncbi:hypothetical protein OG552_10270 [Streptomyces sp. NBC_01476]|uniref:hypothetical protein n=1 Tax=Streptomyces sp. NBC_01476 TaxID=2903881 RepID=UPI002E35FDF8|nr:hypothetical protein [Streptomyces sp. NBC_01476]
MNAPRIYADTLEEKWAARTTRTEGGHLLWTGCLYLRFDNILHKPARVAFTIRTGREPIGYVRPDCGLRGCVEPTHVEDQPGRATTRAALRAVNGLPPRPPVCVHGHDQAGHGRYTTDGRAYCNTCLINSRTRPEAAA